MNTRLFALGGALLLALVANPVAAEILTVDLTAHVDFLDDPGSILGGQIAIGQFAKGRYKYETTVPNYWAPYIADNSYGEYAQDRTQGLLNFTVGSFTFESDPTSWNWATEMPNNASFRIQVRGNTNYYQNYQTYFQLMSQVNKPLPSGAGVGGLNIYLSDMSGTALTSGSLPTTAPNVASFADRQAWIWGQSPAGDAWYLVRLQIDSMAVAPVLLVSPANSSFVRPQRIDPAVLLMGSGQISGLRASVNGAPLPTEYLGQCQIAPPNTQNRPAMTCPNIVPLLPSGPNHVEWNADLTDGSTATSAADWEVID
jgi:hypothetical protein